ncbi:hypothetical protein ACKKBF_B17000 [Auxenochlorella protothecoides x Auxenochlorella symbiontica]
MVYEGQEMRRALLDVILSPARTHMYAVTNEKTDAVARMEMFRELSRVVLQDRDDEEELLEARSQEVGMASRSSHLVGSEEHSEEDDGPSLTGSEINEILDMEEDDPYAFTITD